MRDTTWLRNPVCEVFFAGFSSDTLTLQQNGWEISAEQDGRAGEIRLALQHRQAGVYALTNSVNFRSTMGTWQTPAIQKYGHLLKFQVCMMSSIGRCTMAVMREPRYGGFTPVSALPETSDSSTSEMKFEDLVPFRAVNPNAEQIIVAPDSVPQILDLLLKIQSPAARERRLRQQRTDVRRAADIQAQVLVEVA